ncbi:translation initiation factor IF-3 [Candidatus Cyrtobacter comes]|uniref:translation initiation factor IF-3 n=1 Tax=Candidatus Cyrtobacter comes TaxID=675776 RepID=UPI002ACDD9A8|nr:translation initiation factor IF-3 [Candidatus Cyrtobacter comes]
MTAHEVRVVDELGSMLGVMSVREAVNIAAGRGLNLIEISPNASPPVCKIMDLGKYRYEKKKRIQENKKKQKVIEIKEIKLSPNIEDGDFSIKLKKAREFIEEGNKIKVSLQFKGREIMHKDVGFAVIKRFKEEVIDLVRVDSDHKLEGRQIIMILSPKQ